MIKKNYRLPLCIIILCIIFCFLVMNETLANDDMQPKNRTIIDCIDRKVAIPQKIEKIGCLFAFSGHTVAMLGRGNDIVAVVGLVDVPDTCNFAFGEVVPIPTLPKTSTVI